MKDIVNRNFLPLEVLDSLSNEEFYNAIDKNEVHFQNILKNAEEKGARLKYVAQLEQGKASVGLQEIESSHDFYYLEQEFPTRKKFYSQINQSILFLQNL